jgi:phospholipid:diacylglycerol acyltransferase
VCHPVLYLVIGFLIVRLMTMSKLVHEVTKVMGNNATEWRIGRELAQQNFTASHPVVIFPGLLSTSLEMWLGADCAASEMFRSRFWASSGFVRKVIISPFCLLDHLLLNATTHSDPDGIKLRAVEGFSAADYWLGEEGMVWLWAPLLHALSDVGYTPRNLHMASYDWRLSPDVLEERDAFFSFTVARIEALYRANGKRVVLVSHSMGAIITNYLIHFAEAHQGKGWVDKHIEAVASAGGAWLGAPKALSMLTSGLVADVMPIFGLVVDQAGLIADAGDLASMGRTIGSGATLLPKGGSRLWNEAVDGAGPLVQPTFTDADVSSADSGDSGDAYCAAGSSGSQSHLANFLAGQTSTVAYALVSQPTMSAQAVARLTAERVNHSLEAGVVPFLKLIAPSYGQWVDDHFATDLWTPGKNPDTKDQRRWTNPLSLPLPIAPSTLFMCGYGVGIGTERAFSVRKQTTRRNCTAAPLIIDETMSPGFRTTPHGNWTHRLGVVKSSGDATVPLLSLGFLCARGWKSKTLNPSAAPTLSIEYTLDGQVNSTWGKKVADVAADPLNLMRKAEEGDHVDVLGNTEFLSDVLHVACGRRAVLRDRITSDIVAISERAAKQLELVD